ncbi:LPP leucine zipper domain-containing protein [Vibrio caribbeanicus]|uniref:Major outer membrane lipoprotein Lpp n=1 Tax=Vibrio caribbeanicus ATCC BAA-2122 TaxID=796620 RepID=E3BJG3_9VIBR|nr:LPP leucine zipper domain-containing protein [Vibrio caribbeanicus]EFP96732.1 outer membrane lipoprotein [Vibrio caribbeanicus ATCC BAA-2122]
MNKMMIAAATVLLLAGCASNSATSAKIDELSDQVKALQSDVRMSGDAAKAAQEEAKRANERIDNIAQSYRK